MTKYDFVLLSAESDAFVEQLRSVGLVDITTLGWEPSEQDRSLILEVEALQKVEQWIEQFRAGEEFDQNAAPCKSGSEAIELYNQTIKSQTALNSAIAQLSKNSEELRNWGEFDAKSLNALGESGVKLYFFVANGSTFESHESEWNEQYTIHVVEQTSSATYFVVVADPKAEIMIDAQLVAQPTMNYREAQALIETKEAELDALAPELSRVAASVQLVSAERIKLVEKLQRVQVRESAEQGAEGALLVMEGWAEEATSSKVDSLMESMDGVVYIKSRPTPEDNTPVKLNNGWFAKAFELVGNLYAMPKYGTLDLTAFFAPFYMLFFAICLCDAGYGAVILAAGLALLAKGGDSMRQAGLLSTLCGAASVVFGVLANSFFGMTFDWLPTLIDFRRQFFAWSMYIGIFQICFGLSINVFMTIRNFGFKYCLGQLGWLMMIVACFVAGMGFFDGFTTSSPIFLGIVGVAAVLMLLLNTPGQNIFKNFGVGLWDTYNNITGLMGDVLSYIRLFAIGMSGGILAQVFNQLAMGLTGLDKGIESFSVGVVGQIIGAALILLIGHGINLFMSSISSMVHPMRLTFVEFYKNAGFEMAMRKFNPIK